MDVDEPDDERNTRVMRRDFLQLTAAIVTAAMTTQVRGESNDDSPSEKAQRPTVCVLGASGHVGGAIVVELLSAGYHVVAISRSADKLQKIRSEHQDARALDTLLGDVSSDARARQLRTGITQRFGKPSAIVASLSSPAADAPIRILDTPTDTLREAFNTNFFSHVTAAVTLIPSLQPGGAYVGISGGLSDFVVPNMGAISMTQSALRTLYSVLAKEAQDEKAHDSKAEVRMLALYGLVATEETPGTGARFIEARQVGIRVRDIVRRPAEFPGPLLSLKAKQYS